MHYWKGSQFMTQKVRNEQRIAKFEVVLNNVYRAAVQGRCYIPSWDIQTTTLSQSV